MPRSGADVVRAVVVPITVSSRPGKVVTIVWRTLVLCRIEIIVECANSSFAPMLRQSFRFETSALMRCA